MNTGPSHALSTCLKEVAEFADAQGWDQPPLLFALVPTRDLAAAEPGLADQLATGTELTPIAQEELPSELMDHPGALEEFLATTSWPDAVAGCALVQQIMVLPPDAEADLDEALAPLLADPDAIDHVARETAATHPGRRDARLIAGVLRDGPQLCLLQLRPEDDSDPFADPELRGYPGLAPNIVDALRHTLD